MAKKRGKSTGAKSTKTTKGAVRRPAPRSGSHPAGKKPAVRPMAAAPSRRPATAPPSSLDRAERLRDQIQRSKMTHPDPWRYTTKARAWTERTERLVADAAAGRDVRRALDGLVSEVEGDRDFQEARRLF